MALRVASLIWASMIVAASAHAQPAEIRRGPAPAWVKPSEMLPVPAGVSGAVFMRRQDVQVHLGDRGQAQYLGYRIKVLQPGALALGNLSVIWSPAAGSPIVHDIKLLRDGEAVDVLQTSAFEILRREDRLEEAMLDGMLTAVLRVPDLRVGDELEVDLTIFSRDPSLGNNDSGMLLLGPGPAPGRYRLGLSWDPGYTPNYRMTPDMTAVLEKGDNRLDFRFDNPPVLSPPKDAPPRYQWQRAVEYSDFADWPAVSRHFAALYGKAATLSAASPIRREIGRIAAAHALPLDRAAAALKLVQQDVRYVYVGLNGGNLTPATADQTWQRRYGDCKAKTAMLLAMLAGLGIDAEAVLVNASGTDDGLDQRLAIPQYFDHVLVRAHIGGKDYWLDGTLPPVAPPAAGPIFPVKWVLPLTAEGRSIERMPWQWPTMPDDISMFEIDARAGFDKPARIVSTQIVRGVKGLQQYSQFSSIAAAQLLDVFRQNLVGSTWQAIDDVQWRYDEKAGASILTISGTGMVDWDDDGDGEKSLDLPGGGFNPPERRVRAADQNQDAPFYSKPDYSCSVTTVRLPSSTQPRQWSSSASFDQRFFGRNYHRAWELRDGAIRMVRGSRIESPEISPAMAETANKNIAAFDNSKGWISYKPSRQKAFVGNGEQVPATYDFDWTADEVPCVWPVKVGIVGSAS